MQIHAAVRDRDKHQTADRECLRHDVLRAVLLLDSAGPNVQPASVVAPIRTSVQVTARVGPGIHVLIADARKVWVSPKEFVADARPVAQHETILHGPSLQELRGGRVRIEIHQSECGEVLLPRWMFDLFGAKLEQVCARGGLGDAEICEKLTSGSGTLRVKLLVLIGGKEIARPTENNSDLVRFGAMGEGPCDCFGPALPIAGNCVVQGQVEASLRRLGVALNVALEVEPTFGLAFAIAFETL